MGLVPEIKPMIMMMNKHSVAGEPGDIRHTWSETGCWFLDGQDRDSKIRQAERVVPHHSGLSASDCCSVQW